MWNIIGVGNTATVYEWEEGKVLKLFHQGFLWLGKVNALMNNLEVKNEFI